MKKLKSFENFSYSDVLKNQQIGNPAYDLLFSDEDAEFELEEINIDKLRKINGFEDGDQTLTDFIELGLDEDESITQELFNKIVDGVELSPIVVDENYKLLDGRHRLAAYSELYYFYGYDFYFDGKLKIYKRIQK
jgi:hypothetical protein